MAMVRVMTPRQGTGEEGEEGEQGKDGRVSGAHG